jgi:uncharacterized protein (DUF1778 family)
MAQSTAHKEANARWNKENMNKLYDRIQVLAPKGEKDTIQAAAQQAGQSISAYILEAVRRRMEQEQAEQAAPGDE